MKNATHAPLIYRKNTVLELLGISATTLSRWIEKDGFPRPKQLGARAVGWVAAECHAWLAARPVAKGLNDEG